MKIRLLEELIASHYRPEEYPALYAQIGRWRTERPFQGRRILDATPVFRNTCAKYLALLAGGAELSVGVSGKIPADPASTALLKECGIPLRTPEEVTSGEFDVICDCCGCFAHAPGKFGNAELTRSGITYYEKADFPVFFADSGRIKILETELGTGDGFSRALTKLGYDDVAGKKFLIFGGGKVGRGVAFALFRRGALPQVVEMPQRQCRRSYLHYIDLADDAAIRRAIGEAWCIVTATGLAGAVEKFVSDMRNSSALIANIGVEDEFGPSMPADRVLNRKAPLNFLLDEPTHLKYIDPTMALDNLGAVSLLRGACRPGLNEPPLPLEQEILEELRRFGCIREEMSALDPELLHTENAPLPGAH